MKSSTAVQVVAFACVALAALTVRPVWMGVRMIGAPERIRAQEFKGEIVQDGPPTPEEVRRAEGVLMQTVGPDQVVQGFTPAQVEAAVRSNRMMDRARYELWQEQKAKDLATAERRRPIGYAVIGTCAALLVIWGVGGWMYVRSVRRQEQDG